MDDTGSGGGAAAIDAAPPGSMRALAPTSRCRIAPPYNTQFHSPLGTETMSILMQVLRDSLKRAPKEALSPARASNPLIQYLEMHPDGRAVDRWHHYFDIYHRHFARFRGTQFTMIEIGIFNGGSLPMWREYFGSKATIVGVDVNAECVKFAEPGIEIMIGDQADRVFLASISDRYKDIAIVLDDGGHRMHQQIATFEELYPHLRPGGGVYLCEDTHTSYMPVFGGGYGNANTFIETSKSLIDKIHAFHSLDTSVLAPDDFTRSTDSLHFYDSVLVIEKRERTPPHRVSYGKEAEFTYVAPSLSGRRQD
ncbi:MAG: hypothetical protein IT521_13885 [Burkholderiales bacterium]|nr:hypothetical protein [Burkholderiales bacterium]